MAHNPCQKLSLRVRSKLRMLARVIAGWFDRRPRGDPERAYAAHLVKDLGDVTTLLQHRYTEVVIFDYRRTAASKDGCRHRRPQE
jgi:hypothetical protein